MTHPDGPIAPLPSWSASLKPRPVAADDLGAESFDAPARKTVSAQLIGRALRRHWWQALGLWLVGSTALMALAYARVNPTFSAISQIRVEPAEHGLFHESGPLGSFQEKIETEVVAVTSPPVLGEAVAAHPDLANIPRLRGALDLEAEIRQALLVRIVPKTHLIQVEMASESPVEAANVVNAVVQAYIKYASSIDNKETSQRIQHLEETKDERLKELKAKRDELNRLSERIGSTNADTVSKYNSVTVDQYRSFTEQLTQVEIQRIAAQAKLAQLQAERDNVAPPYDERDLALAVRDAFYTDPRVAALQMQRERLEVQLERVMKVTRSRDGNDPSLLQVKSQLDRVSSRVDSLWVAMAPRLRAQLTRSTGMEGVAVAVRETQATLAAIEAQERGLRAKLEQMNIESKSTGTDALRLEYAQHDVQRAAEVLHKAEDMLYQLKFEIRAPKAKVHLEFPAKPSNRPSSENRIKIMALTPFVVAFAVLGLLVAVEAGAGRVSDPDDLPSRARLQVLGVVPPLPDLRPTAGMLPARDEYRAQRQLDEFVQSLDHLRVALCARPDPWGRNRHCVLITSACGSEGKTTLAAQLAERCVNAGLLTLLIDADLRNPTLSRMLDAAENPGLVNVLRGAVEPEDAMIVVADAGGFHFLPAGTPKIDPSRLLQGDALGKLLAQARESFDMIIVDAPPVLPVPDALTIGRWTDGAVLAVRYDTSRFALVERAQRRLAHVGVPVIGGVVNGVRSVEMQGYYSAAYGGAVEGDSTAGPDLES